MGENGTSVVVVTSVVAVLVVAVPVVAGRTFVVVASMERSADSVEHELTTTVNRTIATDNQRTRDFVSTSTTHAT
jgi:hypothetical protein